MGKLDFDPFRKVFSYRCDCGKRVSVPFDEIQVGSIDYCGCGRLTVTINERDIARQREFTGLPETSE